MLNQDNIYVILYSLPIYQLLFYTVQLVTFRRTSPSKRYLGLLMLVMTAFLLLNAMLHLGYGELFSGFYVAFVPVLLTVAPVFFLYILSLTREDHDVSTGQKLLFLLPPLLIIVLNIFSFTLLPGNLKLTFINQGFSSNPVVDGGLRFAEIVFWLGTLGLTTLQFILVGFRVRSIILNETRLMSRKPSYLPYLNLTWLLIITVSVMVFILVNSLVNIIGPERNIGISVVYNVLMLTAGGLAGYYGMKQNSLLLQVSGMTEPGTRETGNEQPEVNELPSDKAADFMRPEEALFISESIIRLMEEKKPYLSSEFSMGDLCTMLSQSRRKVTFVINDYMQKNFYGIVNDYRIKEALELLSQDKNNNYKIEVIAEMVGFQSKSSFNACFKKYTGQTPSEYKLAAAVNKASSSED
jgi:AraC-like DNA-binding protein